jgi:CDP-diacylglycerol--glycerol-3-phosphate 3-phosphatidyltransferase
MVLLMGILVYFLKSSQVNQLGVILCFASICGSVMVSYIKARCEGAGITCKGGIFQRPERVIILSAGLLAGPSKMVWILCALTVFSWITVIQRIFEAAANSRKLQQEN